MKNLLRPILTGLCIVLMAPIGFSQTHFTATLTGSQENPAATTDARGTGVFLLTGEGLEFTITVEGLEFTAAHFHNGATGANGGVVRNIGGDFSGNTASGIWRSTDAQALTSDLMAELMLGNIYVNVHTPENPSGEIRGQLSPFEIFTDVESVDNPFSNAQPLLQNAPNPFSVSTQIQFNLSRPGPTVLKVYNLAGAEVATLADEHLQAGAYKVTFEPQNLPAGVYICRLESNGLNAARKMILK